MILFLMTPLFGSLKNYVKYKQFNLLNFIRTPLVYLLLQCFLRTDNYWKLLIIERWVFFVLKIMRSLWRNDYLQKKEKYIKKYKLKYD